MPLPPALAPLARLNRFITYRLEPDVDRPGKTIKKPTNPRTGYVCDPHNPENQTSYAEAEATGRGVGFVFAKQDGYWFLDIDGALSPDGRSWSPLANDLCAMFPGAAVEVSQSGKGLHLFGRGIVPEHSCKNVGLGLEFYTDKRFVALTGTSAIGDVDSDHSAAVAALVARYFPPNAHSEVAGWTSEPVPDWDGPRDDAALLAAALASGKKSVAARLGGDAVTFADLWHADSDKLAKKWPGTSGPYDASHADAALAAHLAFWTGKNCERIRELMWQSELARDKWEARPDWLEMTIMRACAVTSNVAQGRKPTQTVDPEVAHAAGVEVRDPTREFLSSSDQIEYFAGCVYVTSDNKIWTPQTGVLLDKARFDVRYGGHIFPVDPLNEKPTSSAFDAFTQSRVFSAPFVDATCFRPGVAPGAIIDEEGWRLVNTYMPIETKAVAGDASPFIDHMARLFPDERDRSIVLTYMAAVIRNPGRKAQWWPVIQGAEGNGKSLINRVMAHCIGSRYTHLVSPTAMAKTGNQFNKWVEGNLYLGIEEIYVARNRDFLESFKPTVTDDRVPLEGKGSDQRTGDNCLNGFMFTNHRDAVPTNVDTRRYAIFYTAQQTYEQIVADGMGGWYFPDLYSWCKGIDKYADLGPRYGFAVINHYLRHEYEIVAEFDPYGICVRAPRTSSTTEALQHSLGTAEAEILEAIEQGRPGFAGGWVSSIAVDRLLEALRIRVPRTARRDMMRALGYVYHPGLREGRCDGIVAPDNGKPRLFIKPDHLAANLTGAAAISKAYTTAQNNAACAVALDGAVNRR